MNELDNVDGLVVNALASMKAGNYDIAIENIVLAKDVNKYKSELYVCLAKIFLLMNKNDKALRNILIYFTLERFKEIKKGKTGNSQNIIKKEIYENILWEKEISDGLKVDLNQIPNLKDLLTPYADLLLHPTEIYITGTAFISEHINILENNSIDSSILIRIKDEIKKNTIIQSIITTIQP